MKRAVAPAIALVALWAAVAVAASAQSPPPQGAEARAVAFLAREVPRWRQEHPCYSCHNNGDGTRALIAASRRNLIDAGQLGDAVAWLRTPERWAQNSEEGGVKDLPLARIQFAAALELLVDAGGADAAALDRAAALMIADQRRDGSWPISAAAAIGSPAAYGTPLATAVARRVLVRARGDAARRAVGNADNWFRVFEAQSVLDASAALLGLDVATDADSQRRRALSLEIVKQGQAADGGWGPYTSARAEPFDTAVALLALSTLRAMPALAEPAYSAPALRAAIARGRTYLLQQQNDDGSWQETTRPAGQESYAQRISTTGWATLALLTTND
jgi:hypothetical protein